MKKINKILLSTLFLLTGCNNVNDIETIKIFSHLGKIEEQEIQKLTDNYIKKIDEVYALKEKDIMTI